jgi:hypothetical protein
LRACFAGGGEAGRAVRVGAIVIVEPAEQGQNEHPGRDQHHGTADPDKAELGDHAVLIQLENQIDSSSRANSPRNSTIANMPMPMM